MSLPTINPTDARRLLDEGATLIDIRESRRARARENSGGAKPAIVETRRSRCRGASQADHLSLQERRPDPSQCAAARRKTRCRLRGLRR